MRSDSGSAEDGDGFDPVEDKLAAQKQVKELESARNRKRRELFEAQDGLDRRRDELIGQMEKQLKGKHETKPLFAF